MLPISVGLRGTRPTWGAGGRGGQGNELTASGEKGRRLSFLGSLEPNDNGMSLLSVGVMGGGSRPIISTTGILLDSSGVFQCPPGRLGWVGGLCENGFTTT